MGDQPFEEVGEFKYLGRVLESALYKNLEKTSKCWKQSRRILEKGVAYVKTSGILYRVVVQAILLYGSEKWVLTVPMLTNLGGENMGVSKGIA